MPTNIRKLGFNITEANIELEPVEQFFKRLMVRKGKKWGDDCDHKCQLGQLLFNKTSGGKLFPKNSRGKPTQVNKLELNKQPDLKNTQAAKDSKGLQRIGQDKNYGLCLAGSAVAFSTAYYSVTLTPIKLQHLAWMR